jgi:hypothetical protein
MILTSRKRSRPIRVNIAGQVTDVTEEEGLDGAPTLTVDVDDPEWLITNEAVLDLDADGKLDHVETSYGGKWWRLVKVSPTEDSLSLVFEHRVVSILRRYTKRIKRRRVPGYTRAMFIRDLVKEARHDGHKIEFKSPKMKTAQQIAKGETPRREAGDVGERGFGKKHGLTVKGVKANKAQLANATIALNVAHQLSAPYRAQLALVEALIAESRITNLMGGDRDSSGVLQVRRGVHRNVNPRDIEQVVTLFLTRGFTGQGGAITLANSTTKSAHAIAQAVQGSAFSDGSNYKANEAEAREWIKKFHVITDPNELNITGSVDRAYYFTRGQVGGAKEDSWSAMNRLAEEVGWRIFIQGNTVVFIEDNDLYKQAPKLLLSRTSPRMTGISFDWDQGKPVQEAQITIQRTDLLPGTTVEIADAGPASTRWLIFNVRRSRSSGFSEVTLRSPQTSKAEPAPERETVTISGNTSEYREDVYGKLTSAMQSVSSKTPGYTLGGGHGQDLDDLGPGTRFDCSSSVSWVLKKAGLFDPDKAWVSGDFAKRYGRPGEGKMFTVWANDNHVWIELKVGRYKRFDTGGEDGGKGAKLHTTGRSSGGFVARHAEGM